VARDGRPLLPQGGEFLGVGGGLGVQLFQGRERAVELGLGLLGVGGVRFAVGVPLLGCLEGNLFVF
jgi:hypothetical protein